MTLKRYENFHFISVTLYAPSDKIYHF